MRLRSVHEDTSERLLHRLLGASREELPAALWRAVVLLDSASIGVNFESLVCDVALWERSDGRSPRREWARAYYRVKRQTAQEPPEATTEDVNTTADGDDE